MNRTEIASEIDRLNATCIRQYEDYLKYRKYARETMSIIIDAERRKKELMADLELMECESDSK